VSVLMLALYKRHAQVARFLSSHNHHPSVWEAAALGLDPVLRRLLDAQPESATAYSVDGFTPLGLACYFGHPACVELLLERGADVHAPSRNGMCVRPLHSALSHDDPVIAAVVARRLLAAGADLQACQQGGYSPLHLAAGRGNLGLVELLLEAGADPAARADNGLTPTDAARGHRPVAQALAAGGAAASAG
jgi:ankyrin repeat protein